MLNCLGKKATGKHTKLSTSKFKQPEAVANSNEYLDGRSMKPEELIVLQEAQDTLRSATSYIDNRTWLRPKIDATIKSIDALLEPLRPICKCCGHKGSPTLDK